MNYKLLPASIVHSQADAAVARNFRDQSKASGLGDTNTKMAKIIVVGAGASGLMAAGQAASRGAEVFLLEKKKRPGNKIAISGKGRCNLTNTMDIDGFLEHFNRSGRFLRQPFSHFFSPQLMQFFEELGVPLISERGGRVFPASGSASDVVEAMLDWLKRCGVTLNTSIAVDRILRQNGFVTGVCCRETTFTADSVVLATGGASYPATGSTGDGYTLAQSCGHTLTPLRPALVPLLVDDPVVHTLAGLDLKNAGVRIYVNDKRKISSFGEVSFTRFGIGGPIILTHSLFIVDNIRAGKKITLSLDLKPALDDRKLDNRLLRDFEKRCHENIDSVLRGLLPREMVAASLHFCSIDGHKSAGQILSQERIRLRTWLKDFRFSISGYRPLSEAIVTAGGIKVQEIDPNTMESRKTKGLYLTGELLDIHGDTGGYNLQAAFSTGWLAGRSAASAAQSASSPT